MKNLAWLLICSLLCTTPAWAEEAEKTEEAKKVETTTTEEFDDYDKQFEESMKEMTAQLQTMTSELVKYMNTLNKSLNATMPQMTNSMHQVISSMKPVAETMQKNMDSFVKELNQQLDVPNVSAGTEQSDFPASDVLSPEHVVLPEAESEDITPAIDKELADFAPPISDLPQRKIKLFSSTVE